MSLLFLAIFISLDVAFLVTSEKEGYPPKRWLQAVYLCSTEAKTLPHPWTIIPGERFSQNPEGLWALMQRVRTFHWTNGLPFQFKINRLWVEDKKRNCGVFYFTDKTFESDKCLKRHRFICQLPECSACPEDRSIARCFTSGDTAFSLHEISLPWQNARKHCQQHSPKGDLVQMTNMTHMMNIINRLNLSRLDIGKVWVGYHKDFWISGMDDEAEERVPWAPGEPSDAGDCAVIVSNGTSQFTRASLCTARHGFQCVNTNRIDTSPPAVTSSLVDSFSDTGIFQENASVAVVSVGDQTSSLEPSAELIVLPFFATFLILFGAAICWRHKRIVKRGEYHYEVVPAKNNYSILTAEKKGHFRV